MPCELVRGGRGRRRRCVVLLGAFLCAAPALAEVVSPEPLPGARAGSNTELTFTSLGPGQGVSGFIANPSNPFNPVTDGYPAGNPTSGFSVKNLSFAGVLNGTPTGGGDPLALYCIDILTETNVGIGYELGTWDQATVPNVGYVARLLNSNYPTVATAPPGLANDNQRAAATQSAVWFFTDRYVLNTSDPLHNAVATLVAQVIAAGPLVEPPPPTPGHRPAERQRPGRLAGRPVHRDVVDRRDRDRRRLRRHDVLRRRRNPDDRQRRHCYVGHPDLAAVHGPSYRGPPRHRPRRGAHGQRLSLRRQHARGRRKPRN